jgi:hypothetical protein
MQNFLADVATDTARHADETAQDEQAEFVGDLPDEPDEAAHVRPGPEDDRP